MAITREQWEASPFAKQAAKAMVERLTINQDLLKQAVVASELLTGHPAWDVYLQRLQVQVDLAGAEQAMWQAKIAGAYEDADLRLIQTQLNIAATKVAILGYCMSLPKEILTHAATTLDK